MIRYTVLFLGMIVVLLSLRPVAAEDQTHLEFNIIVSIEANDIALEISAGEYHAFLDKTAVRTGETIITPAKQDVTVTNVGGRNITVSIQASTNETSVGHWTQRVDGLGNTLNANEYRISAIFTNAQRSVMTAADFGDEDVLNTVLKPATSTALAYNQELDRYKGFNIPPGESRSLFFRFDAPPTVTYPGELLIDIGLHAQLP